MEKLRELFRVHSVYCFNVLFFHFFVIRFVIFYKYWNWMDAITSKLVLVYVYYSTVILYITVL